MFLTAGSGLGLYSEHEGSYELVGLPSGPVEVGYGHLLLALIAVRDPTDDAAFIGKLTSQRHPKNVALLVVPVQDEAEKFDVQFLFSDRFYIGATVKFEESQSVWAKILCLCKGALGSQGSGSAQWHH